jgi:butyryl-CoA dehydrogenase
MSAGATPAEASRATLEFLLFDWLGVEALAARPRHAEHSRSTFVAVLEACERLARERFAPANRTADIDEPRLVDGRVVLPEATAAALAAYAESGMPAAAHDAEWGGMQLPCVVEMAAQSFFFKASVAIAGYAMLTQGNANLLLAHGTPRQRAVFAAPELAGRWFGTMCLSEPQAGSSLSDIATRALPDGPDFEADPLGPRYRLHGQKMWISGGEHELGENIVHLVLAKIPGADGRPLAGTRGISLFVVPRRLVDAEGALTGLHNDVALVGLNHKLGYRGTVNTLLDFGGGRPPVRGAAGAIGYRVGAAGAGLAAMFHMMNEERIGVGLGATMLGVAGYEQSLAYARERPQGRPAHAAAGGGAAKDSNLPQVPIIEHADVKRMLLAQKSVVEGALALALYCARLVDETRTGDAAAAAEARLLLEVLTPVAKSWPSRWCLEANSLAIQVLGGYGYTRDFAVEQHWRDNRLNMIHEGTHGIHGLDLLGRKVVMQRGAGLDALARRVGATVAAAQAFEGFAGPGDALAGALARLVDATQSAWASGDAEAALANATPYLEAFGHVVVAWLWLDVALAAARSGGSLALGQRAAQRYFYAYELPQVDAWLAVVARREAVCREMRDEWF